ncbi:MAG: hypothetical protein AB7S50_03610 [Bacteroidales bacterium]
MYRIALVQNESEMMRYGWADIKPSLERTNYIIDTYTSENITSLSSKLKDDKYDAIFIAMNACKNIIINAFLTEEKDKSISKFLSQNKGLYIGYQARMDSIDFLPKQYAISFKNRHENSNEGNLQFHSHNNTSVLNYPHIISSTEIKNQCNSNDRVEGIYWSSINLDKSEKYDILISDSQNSEIRPLLITSRLDLPSRIIISTLPIEWQGHNNLFNNITNYITEGKPEIAIVTKKGAASQNFKYLISSAKIRKLAVKVYQLDSIDKLTILPKNIHDILVFDPRWEENEIMSFNANSSFLRDLNYKRIFYFRSTTNNDIVFNSLSAFRDFKRISLNSITYLINSYTTPYWSGSFWSTIDVIKTLQEFDRPVKQYIQDIQHEIDTKHDINQSYDEVVGATCGLLTLYYIFYGKGNSKYKATLKWIRRNFNKKTIYEKATAIQTLVALEEEIDEQIIISLKNDILTYITGSKNEFELTCFINTFVTCGYIDEAEKLAERLADLQNPSDGSWINIPNTALITISLLEILKISKNLNESIEEMVFKGIIYIKSKYSESNYNWNNDPLSTALSLRALKKFEEQIEFPIDELLVSFLSEGIQSKSLLAIDKASQMNVALQEKVNQLNNVNSRLTGESRFSKRLSIITSFLTLLFLFITISFLKYLIDSQKIYLITKYLGSFLSSSFKSAYGFVILIPITLFILLLDKYKLLPSWVENLFSRIGKFKK